MPSCLAAVLKKSRTDDFGAAGRQIRIEALSRGRAGSSDDARPSCSTQKSRLPAADAERNETDLGGALLQAVDDAQGRKIAGLVLLTDGRPTAGPDPVAVARILSSVRGDESPAPVFTIPVGSEQAAPDVAVVEIAAPPLVAKDDTVSVEVTLSSSGLAGQTVTSRAARRRRTGPGEPASQADHRPAADRSVHLSCRASRHATAAGNRAAAAGRGRRRQQLGHGHRSRQQRADQAAVSRRKRSLGFPVSRSFAPPR